TLVEHGALMQVTASSIVAAPLIRAATRFLFQHGLVHFLATDAHGVERRRPRLKVFLEKAREWVEQCTLEQLVFHNPGAVLAGAPVEVAPLPERPARAGGLLRAVVQRFMTR